MSYYVACKLRPQTGDIHEQLFTCRIYFNTHGIDAAHDHIVKASPEDALVHIMLVLADTDGFRINLYQLSQWIDEAPADRDSAADSHVMVRKFFTRRFRGRVNRCTAFIDHDDDDRAGEIELLYECLCFTACRAVADSYRFNVEACT